MPTAAKNQLEPSTKPNKNNNKVIRATSPSLTTANSPLISNAQSMTKTNTKPEEIIFVGNGDNDEWAYKSGCKTICINPVNTDSKNRTIWHSEISSLESLAEI